MKSQMKDNAYGFHVGQIVRTKVDLKDENGGDIPAGSNLRIVAIAPKIHLPKKEVSKSDLKLLNLDRKVYFFNAVRQDQAYDYHHRIRANFCTIEKIK